MKHLGLLLVLTLSTALAASRAFAHDAGLSATRVVVGPTGIATTTTFHREDVPASSEVPIPVALSVRGERIVPSESTTEPNDSHTLVRLEHDAAASGRIRVEIPALQHLPIGHKHALRIEDETGQLLADGILDRERPFVETSLSAVRFGALHVSKSWFTEGLRHIATGWDHLLFLLALVITCPALPRVVRVVTGFTVGHSASLAAATLGGWTVPPSFVEPAIAASIVAVAVSNLTRRSPLAESLPVALGFGLLHGLGFAGFLSGLGVGGSSAAVLPLAAFNVGVEAGQVALLALAVPLLAGLTQAPRFRPRFVSVGSVAIAAVSSVWLWERMHALL